MKTLYERLRPEMHHKLAVLNQEIRSKIIPILESETSFGNLTITNASFIAYNLGVSMDMALMQSQLLEQ